MFNDWIQRSNTCWFFPQDRLHPNGVVAVPANGTIPAASGTYAAPWQSEIRLEPHLAR